MNRRSCLALLTLPPLAACASDPAGGFLGGVGDPVRGAALNAPFSFGNLGTQRGQPGRVALSLVQLEFLADRVPQDPYWQNRINPLTSQQLQRARNIARQVLGIPADAPPDLVMDSLRRANAALEGLNPAGARAALSGRTCPPPRRPPAPSIATSWHSATGTRHWGNASFQVPAAWPP
jgi:hypothetical protein